MKRYYILLIGAMLLGISSNAQITCTSNGLNKWGQAFTCSGSGSPTSYIIQASDSVYMGGTQFGVDTLIVYGILQLNNNRTLNVNAGGVVQVMPGGVIKGGNSSTVINFTTGVDPTGPFNITGPQYSSGGPFQSGYLPVEFLSANARVEKDLLLVEWSTASELNNSHFEVEGSQNGASWMLYGNVPSLAANGNSQEILNYEFAVPMQVASGVAFVRIKQVDFDMTTSYSRVIRVGAEQADNFEITQNDGLSITIENRGVGQFEAKLYDVLGKQVANSNGVNDRAKLSAPANGVYILEVVVDGRSSFRKVAVNP